MKIFFILSGEHKTLPKAEILATLEAIGARFKTLASFDQVLVIDTDKIDGIHKRLALSHKIAEFYGSCDIDRREILSLVEKASGSAKSEGERHGRYIPAFSPMASIRLKDSFCVRIKRIKECGTEIGSAKNQEVSNQSDSPVFSLGSVKNQDEANQPAFSAFDLKCTDLEKEIGTIIKNKTCAKVDLKRPEEIIEGVITNKFVIGKRIYEIDRSEYEKRRPHKRPFFHPGTMLPRTCRAFVNLTRIKTGEKLADPFCGTGGFLIEAGLIGAKVYGFDIEEEFVAGCRKNLEHYGIKNSALEVADARHLDCEEFFDAVIADPPYGISSSTRGLSLKKLYTDSLKSFYRILKPGRYACIISPMKIDTEKMGENVGFKIIEKHTERIHRSLTRKIVVIKKQRE